MAVEVDEASNGVVGGGGVEGGACRKFLQPDGTKSNSTRFRVSCWRGGVTRLYLEDLWYQLT
jgi:hypothetical protein